MSNTKDNPLISFFGKRWYFYLALIASIPIYFAIESFVRSIHVKEDEAVATAVTFFFITGIFAGRQLAIMRTSRQVSISDNLLYSLAILIIACTAWLFFHADFPLQGREAINLLLFWLPLILISLAMGMLIKLARAKTAYELNIARASAAQSQSELRLLQSQLSPHFLFNTLNNLYGLSISQHEKLPPLLLKLSELLRYSVYDATEKYVLLKDELAYVNNYIEFEKIRIGNRLVLQTDIEAIPDTDIRIAPMLLIVFIENAFKHSKNTADQQIFIDISLKTWGNSILFSVKNSCGNGTEEGMQLDRSSGFGLANVQKRLELLYPGEHELTLQKEAGNYTVLLQLKMK